MDKNHSMLKNPQKMGEITEKRAKNGRFPPNARLNGLARFKTGDLTTLAGHKNIGQCLIFSCFCICVHPPNPHPLPY